jgi:hypothetical protein
MLAPNALIAGTEQLGSIDNVPDLYIISKCPVRIPAGTPTILFPMTL